MRTFIALTLGLALSAGLTACRTTGGARVVSPEARTVFDVAQPFERPLGAPKSSDVVMRTLRPRREGHAYDTLAAIRNFHATRLDWTYYLEADFIAKANALGVSCRGALAGYAVAELDEYDPDVRVRLGSLNLDGEPVIPSFARGPGKPRLWGCQNNPTYLELQIRKAMEKIDAGVAGMQRDEPNQNQMAPRWGACFCEHCMRQFNGWLAQNTTAEERAELGIDNLEIFNYAEQLRAQDAPVGDAFWPWDGGRLKELFIQFQSDSSREYLQALMDGVDERAGREIPWSCNNLARIDYSDSALLFDYWFGELNAENARARYLLEHSRATEEAGKVQVITMPKRHGALPSPEWTEHTRRTIAWGYACDMPCMVPWDVCIAGSPRYFGSPEEYADLYAFVRGNAHLLDGYREAAVDGPGLAEARYGETPPLEIVGGSGRVAAVVRATPDEPDSPIVVHIVDWATTPEPFAVALRPERLYGDRSFQVELRTPTPYDEAAHRAAFESGDYSALVERRILSAGRSTYIKVPALAPSGLLVIRPIDAALNQAWQPSIHYDRGDAVAETMTLRLESATPAAEVRYTLDGTQPDPDDTLYTKPIVLSETATMQARAFAPGMVPSPAARLRLEKDSATKARSPEDAALRNALRLHLKAQDLTENLKDGLPVTRWAARKGTDAIWAEQSLPTGIEATPPVLRTDAIGSRAAVAFEEESQAIYVPDGANDYLAGHGFTVFTVSDSVEPGFGMGGNEPNGNGGIPRLYLQPNHYCYDEFRTVLKPPVGPGARIAAFMHDGDKTMSIWVNGVETDSRDDAEVVDEFGAGGDLAIPFRPGGRLFLAGRMGEIIAFDRMLSDEERRGVEAWLAREYGINVPHARIWR